MNQKNRLMVPLALIGVKYLPHEFYLIEKVDKNCQ